MKINTAQKQLDNRDFSEYPALDHWKNRALKAEKRIAELEAVNRWIPVSERLPERILSTRDVSDQVWLVNAHGRQEYGWYDYALEKWKVGFPYAETFHPTYWMPLPAGPEEE